MRILIILILVIGPGTSTPTFPIDQLLDLFKYTNCETDLFGLCRRGTVVIDPWTNYALETQRNLVMDLPLDQVLFIGTHNSFNNRADGYGFGDLVINDLIQQVDSSQRFIWAQQEYTITDQLNMGIRELHLDPHWYADNLRLCHGAGNILDVNKIIADIERILNITIHFDSEQLGCSPFDRLYQDGLSEIHQWQLNNPGEFLFIHQDDNEGDTYNNTATTIQMIVDTFGDSIFTPIDFNGSRAERETPDLRSGVSRSTSWPSIRELVSRNKTIMWQSENYYGAGNGTIIFEPLLWPAWDQNCLNYFSAYPNCQTGAWSNYQGESQIVGPFYDGTKSCGLLVPDNIPQVINCNISVLELDQVSPMLMRSFVWTWAPSYPSSGIVCPYWNSTDGRWYTDDCSSNYPSLCRQDTTLMISTTRGPWMDASCPSKSTFSVLRSSYESRLLMSISNEPVWLNYSLD